MVIFILIIKGRIKLKSDYGFLKIDKNQKNQSTKNKVTIISKIKIYVSKNIYYFNNY